MTTDNQDTAVVVPPPAAPPAEQQLSAEEILAFDPAATVAAAATAGTETCPSCGTAGPVDLSRREATAFCRSCDFPLFWARDRVVLPSADAPDESGLRRLPGTVGRNALASLLCPACSEPNPATGVTCVRCGSELRPRAPEPVVVLPPPPPDPEPEEEPRRAWWPYVVAGALALVALLAVLLVLYT